MKNFPIYLEAMQPFISALEKGYSKKFHKSHKKTFVKKFF